MSRGINKVILVGNLGNEPEVRYTPSGAAVTTISVATTESWKDKDGNKQEKTEWHKVVFYGRLAEIAGEYLRKGSQVYVEGKLRTNKWEKNGVDMYTTEIIANEMQILSSKQGQSTNLNQTPNAPSGASSAQGGFDPFDMDSQEIPF